MNADWNSFTPAAPQQTATPINPNDPIAQLRAHYATLTPEEWTKERDKLLEQWRKEDAIVAAAKAAEMETRTKLVTLLFDPAKDEGTETLELGNGWKVKAQKKLNYTLGNSRADPKFKDVEAALDTIESLPEIAEASFIAERLVRWKPELTLTEYRNLNTDARYAKIKEIIDRVLTVKPGSPSLELIEPAAPGKKRK